MKTIAIIPARSGSKGVKNKNIRLLGGYPLIAYSIIIARQCKLIDRVIVSTDSEDIAVVARTFGAETPFIRPEWASTDTATDDAWMNHLLGWMAQDNPMDILSEYTFVHLRPTTPLRDTKKVTEAIRLFQSSDATSLRSAHPLEESPYKMFTKQGDYFTAFGKADVVNNPRQSFETVYVPNGYVDILSAHPLIGHNNLHGDKILAYETEKVIEVDTEENLQQLELRIKTHPIHRYLQRRF